MRNIYSGCFALSTLFISLHGQAATELFFSEYIEGSSNNKALEIANTTGADVDLSSYEIQIYFNGNTTAGRTIALNGTVVNGDVFVIADNDAAPDILSAADLLDTGSFFNGDDTIVLLNGGTTVDVIGQIGFDPGSKWGAGDTSTQNNTLRRNVDITDGDTNSSDAFDPAAQWQGFAQDTFDDLGNFGGSGNEDSLVINEVDADTAGTDTLEFVELFDGGSGSTSLDNYVLVLFNGSDDASYAMIDLSGQTTNADGYFVVGNASVANVDRVINDNSLQNGADAVALYQTSADQFPNDTPITLENLIDAIVYDTNDADDAALLVLLNEGQAQVNEGQAGDQASHSNQRCDNGAGGTRNTASYHQTTPTPGLANSCEPVVALQCGDTATLIHTIQGDGDTSPLVGSQQIIEGVVVGDFQGSNALNGFFVQEEDAEQDGNAATSEGIFVFDGSDGVNVNAGDRVRLVGSVSENFGQTQISGVLGLVVCATGESVTPGEITLPVNDLAELESLEGMSVTTWQPLTVTETYNLGRYGQLLLSNGRLMNPTQVALPGDDALAVSAANTLNRLMLDDGSTQSNPEIIAYPEPQLSASNSLRVGDTTSAMTGVLNYAFSEYRIHPTVPPIFTATNARTAQPDLPGTGSLKVASFNVLNYFNGNADGPLNFPTDRGADTATEFDRQRDKIISALQTMDADIVGLVELQNNGFGADSAIQNLVEGLSDAGLQYSIVNPGVSAIGSDAIMVSFIYKTDKVALEGNAAILDSSVDPDFIDTKNRPVLAQTFREIATDGKLTIAINHFKSKGSSCDDLSDPNLNDGQGNCNLTRTQAAQALVNWLALDPTGSGDDNVLIMGDLNAYAMEDPIRAIETAGYVNIPKAFDTQTYSYIFNGETGSLDHALASDSLVSQISGATEWHINADEPKVLDYNEEFKSAEQVVSLYDSDAYRASDHDPIIVEINFSKATDLRGDFNGDSKLNGRDFWALIHHLRKPVTASTAKFDLNEDGRISGRDVVIWIKLKIQFNRGH
jgi:uncharacterized protein